MKTRNVFFYAMYLTLDEASLSHNEIKPIFDEVFNNEGTDVHGVKTIEIDGPSSKIFIDKICENETYLYGRLGRINENNSIQIRDFNTCETTDVLDQSVINEKGLEIFTYFLIDYNTGIISTIKSIGAPSVSSLCGLIKKKGDEYAATTKPVFNVGPEIIEKVMNCDVLYYIDMSHAIPDPSVLGQIGVGNKEILALTDAGVGQSYVRTAYRGGIKKPLLKGNSNIKKVINAFVENVQNYDKLILEAKVEGEEREKFNIVEQFAKEKIEISNSSERAVFSDELKLKFIEVYEQNKDRLKINCGR